MMRYSPLRYPGGKGKISSFFSELFVANNLIGGTYIEPYVGGGSIALSLLINGVANQIIINDKDRSLFAFWYSILNYTDEFCQLIENTPITIDTWYEQGEYLQPIITQYFIDNKSEIWLLFLIAHSKR